MWPLDHLEFLRLLFYLLAAHALTDYVWQSEMMANRKRPQFMLYPGDSYGPWWWWMLAHGLINGLGVSLVTLSTTLGVLETGVHMSLDYAKAKGYLSTEQDQLGHLMSKVLWAWLA